MISITSDSLKDFQTCELLYQHKFIDKIAPPISKRALLGTRYENTLKKMASFFFYKKQGGTVPSTLALLNRWEKHWFPKDTDLYDIMGAQDESNTGNLNSYSRSATQSLIQFHADFEADPGSPMLIDEHFVVPLMDEIRVEGIFDLVLRNADEYRVIKWLATPRRPPISSLILDFAALRYAFEYRNEGRSIDVTYGYYDLANPRHGFTEMKVERADINALKYWANEILETSVFVPRQGIRPTCKPCPFENICTEFELSDEVLSEALGVANG